MDPRLFLADLEAKPEALGRLADALERGEALDGLPTGARRVTFVGMGSSRYAAGVAAARLRAAGLDAAAEYASAGRGYPPAADHLVVAISATGGSREVLDAVARVRGGPARSPLLAVTNRPGSAVTAGADAVLDLRAGAEEGGVACRTFQHTGLLLRAVEAAWTGGDVRAVAALTRRVAEATADLLDRRGAWLPAVADLLDGPHGVHVLAPAERLSSAEQSALMVREGPRRPGVGCETGDWAHVDVYLTRTLDYRALLLLGSRYDAAALEWTVQRGSTVVGVGAPGPGGEPAAGALAHRLRYRGDDDPDVALHTETLVAELVAARWWAGA